MAEAPARQRQELAVVGQPEKHLRDGERDELGIADPWPATRPGAGRQEIVDPHVKCGDEGVEVGVHGASLVDVAIATPSFGALVMSPRRRVSGNSESTI